MTATSVRSTTRGLGTWVALALLINAIAFAATRLLHHPAVAYAAAFDVAVTVPALYYLLVVRRGGQPALTLVSLCALALLRATYVIPGGALARPLLGGVAELIVIGFLTVRVRRGLRAGGGNGDVVERLGRAALEIVPVPRLAGVLATEVATLYYAFAWRPTPHVPAGARPFTVHRESGVAGWLGCVAAVSVLEAGVLHLIVARSSAGAAWALTALSVYGAVWLVAMARSFALRPILVSGAHVEIRAGLLATLRAPLTGIAKVESIVEARPGEWKLPPLSAPNVRVTFTTPLDARSLYGTKRGVASVALAVDEPQGFIDALAGEDLRETLAQR